MQTVTQLLDKHQQKMTQNSAPSSQNERQKKQSASACANCGGSKLIRYDVPFGDYRFGKVYPCPDCNQAGVTMNSGLNPDERGLTLSLSVSGRPGTVKMVEAARRFISDPRGMLAICGSVGNGKTHTLKSIVNACLAAGIEARYITMTDLMAYAREAFSSTAPGDTDFGRITRIANIPVVCIDEMDKARFTEYAQEIQSHFFDVRYRNAGTLGTVGAWNGSPESFPLPWVVSRFSEYKIVVNMDADVRPMIGASND